jgi:hypothetical protein
VTLLERGAAGDTVLSRCRRFRYCLWRDAGVGNGKRIVVFVGLNPSTADEARDDATVRRCRGFAQQWGYGRVCLVNLFAFRATKPSDLLRASDPIGPMNDRFIEKLAGIADLVVACWGNHGAAFDRAQEVLDLLPAFSCFGTTANGAPKHPLYVPYSEGLKRFRPVPENRLKGRHQDRSSCFIRRRRKN